MAAKATKGIALITGAASGIGQNTAFSFAESGAIGIVFADIDEKGAHDSAEKSSKFATNPEYSAIAIRVDVTDPTSVQAMVDTTVREFGRIDYSVNSAGVGSDSLAEIADSSVEEFDKITNVNMKGTMLCVRAVSGAMRTQEPIEFEGRCGSRSLGRGSIINLGSVNSLAAIPGKVPYTTSKHAVIAITKTAALDNGRHSIRVNAVCPSWVEGPMNDREREKNPRLDGIVKAVAPLGRMAQPDEVGDAIVFLCSPAASYISGVALLIDAGLTLTVRLS